MLSSQLGCFEEWINRDSITELAYSVHSLHLHLTRLNLKLVQLTSSYVAGEVTISDCKFKFRVDVLWYQGCHPDNDVLDLSSDILILCHS